MKRILTITIACICMILGCTCFALRDINVHSGIKICAYPVGLNGALIKMNISAERENQTVRSLTYEIVDEKIINVHVNLDYLKTTEEQESQDIQLLLPTQNEVHFLVNDVEIHPYILKETSNWKVLA